MVNQQEVIHPTVVKMKVMLKTIWLGKHKNTLTDGKNYYKTI
ncbi:MAG: hypothetical protein ACKPE3_10005 [Sphaerospermopsis kisseleviana]